MHYPVATPPDSNESTPNRAKHNNRIAMIKKIISGGQPGVELAALDAAIRLHIPHEGLCYRDRKTDGGNLPERYNVKEIDTPSYFQRREKMLRIPKVLSS